jgi:transposase
VIASPPSLSPALEPAFLAAFRNGTLTESQADAFIHRDPLELKFLLLQLSALIASPVAHGPHAPSSATPPYAKPNTTKRKKKVGAKPGHDGHSRRQPERIDRTVVHELPPCPCCGGTIVACKSPRKRIVEDIPEELKIQVTEHVVPRGYCSKCKKTVEAKVPDAMPGATLGHRAVALTAWLHYGLGTTTSQVVEVFNGHLHCPISEGGLTEIWHRLAEVFMPWYEEIQTLCMKSPVLHMDETGWRTAGRTGWLWCATATNATYYWIHDTRGHDALDEFFTQEFSGVLVTDFWSAYDAVAIHQQKCWPHFLRDLKAIDEREAKAKGGGSDEWHGFAKRLRRIYADGIRLKLARDDLSAATFESRMLALYTRITDLGSESWTHADAKRLAGRLSKYWQSLLLFVENRDVPSSNNRAEREIRPAVLMRKVSQGSVTSAGSQTRSVLMSIYRTLKQRGVDVLSATESALRTYVASGVLPPLPKAVTAAE